MLSSPSPELKLITEKLQQGVCVFLSVQEMDFHSTDILHLKVID